MSPMRLRSTHDHLGAGLQLAQQGTGELQRGDGVTSNWRPQPAGNRVLPWLVRSACPALWISHRFGSLKSEPLHQAAKSLRPEVELSPASGAHPGSSFPSSAMAGGGAPQHLTRACKLTAILQADAGWRRVDQGKWPWA